DVGSREQRPRALWAEHTRFALFDTVTTFLKAAAASDPLVLVLDDLHAADLPSLALLHFLSREVHGARILVVGSYRDVDARRTPARGTTSRSADSAGRRSAGSSSGRTATRPPTRWLPAYMTRRTAIRCSSTRWCACLRRRDGSMAASRPGVSLSPMGCARR